MNEFEQNRFRKFENKVNILLVQLSLTNADLVELYNEIYNLYDPDHPRASEIERKVRSIQNRIEAMRSLSPGQNA